MVKSATSLTRNGLRDWLLQRISAVLVGAYVLFLLGYLIFCPSFDYASCDYASWQHLFQNIWMRISTVIVLVAILVHAYIGLWTVSTDYIKCSCIRILFQVVVWLLLFAFVIWGIVIVWGV